jgi:hypothetical protein
MDSRLPAHVDVSALVRQVNAAGGFAAVIRKGERDAGTILLQLVENGRNARVFERMPQLDGSRKWTLIKSEAIDSKQEIDEYLNRRSHQDPDLWIVELDIPDGERFIPES